MLKQNQNKVHIIINETPACRIQFPLQNAFASTVYKTQGITLPQTSLHLDNQIFASADVNFMIFKFLLLMMHFQWMRKLKKNISLEQISNKTLPI